MASTEQSRNNQATLVVSRSRKRKTEGNGHAKAQIICEVKKASRVLRCTDGQKGHKIHHGCQGCIGGGVPASLGRSVVAHHHGLGMTGIVEGLVFS